MIADLVSYETIAITMFATMLLMLFVLENVMIIVSQVSFLLVYTMQENQLVL